MIRYIFQRIFVDVNGGQLDVQTPSGVASVRGSMLGVSFDPQTNHMTATCLEGHCSLSTPNGTIDLTSGQAADILNGILSSAPRIMTDQELINWLNNAPEAGSLANQFPRLRSLIEKLRKLPKPPKWP